MAGWPGQCLGNAYVAGSRDDALLQEGVAGMATRQFIVITAGPGRGELVDALQYAHDENRNFEVAFSGTSFVNTGLGQREVSSGEFTAKIVGLSHDGDSGSRFIVQAYVSIHPLRGKVVTFDYDATYRRGNLDVD